MLRRPSLTDVSVSSLVSGACWSESAQKVPFRCTPDIQFHWTNFSISSFSPIFSITTESWKPLFWRRILFALSSSTGRCRLSASFEISLYVYQLRSSRRQCKMESITSIASLSPVSRSWRMASAGASSVRAVQQFNHISVEFSFKELLENINYSTIIEMNYYCHRQCPDHRCESTQTILFRSSMSAIFGCNKWVCCLAHWLKYWLNSVMHVALIMTGVDDGYNNENWLVNSRLLFQKVFLQKTWFSIFRTGATFFQDGLSPRAPPPLATALCLSCGCREQTSIKFLHFVMYPARK